MKLQPVYSDCFVCGQSNPIGLHLHFWEEDGKVWTEFTPDDRHQGFPGIMHGGLLFTILDEVTGRAAYLQGVWVVTGRIEVRYHRSAHLGEKLRFSGAYVGERLGAVDLKGEARLMDGTLVATASGRFMRLTEEQTEAAEQRIGLGSGTVIQPRHPVDAPA